MSGIDKSFILYKNIYDTAESHLKLVQETLVHTLWQMHISEAPRLIIAFTYLLSDHTEQNVHRILALHWWRYISEGHSTLEIYVWLYTVSRSCCVPLGAQFEMKNKPLISRHNLNLALPEPVKSVGDVKSHSGQDNDPTSLKTLYKYRLQLMHMSAMWSCCVIVASLSKSRFSANTSRWPLTSNRSCHTCGHGLWCLWSTLVKICRNSGLSAWKKKRRMTKNRLGEGHQCLILPVQLLESIWLPYLL